MATLATLVAQYPVLRHLSSSLSRRDLLNIALTCRTHFSFILSSRNVFEALLRDSLCDGSGLEKRQNFEGLYNLTRRSYSWGRGRKIWQDEPIEVRLYGTKCDEVNALPCVKCGVKICEVGNIPQP
jgi:hypothetical protein